MTKVYAYIRVSDIQAQGTSDNQHYVITEYANDNNLTIDKYIEFHVSGSKANATERGITDLLSTLEAGDKIITSDIARLGRENMHDLLNIITTITTKGAEIHFALSDTSITPADTNDIASIFVLVGESYASVKFAEERSKKSKAACDRRNKQGLANGRPIGQTVKSKLDPHAVFILDALKLGTAKTAIITALDAKDCKVSRTQLYRWIDKRVA